MTLSIIDDDPIFQFLTKRMIDKLLVGCCLIQFVDGQQAIDFMYSNQDKLGNLPQLIFLDINMPNLDGWQFLESLESSEIKTYQPFIYMASSSCDQNDMLRAQTYTQIKGYLIKPIMPQTLENIISEFIQTEQSTR